MASARENDLKDDVYIGLSFPLRRDVFNDFALTKNSLQQSRHNLKNLLLTHVGERLAQPEFGSRIRELVFEQINDELSVKIEEEVKRAVSIWLPYININEVNTLTNEGDQNRIFVEVKFTTTLNTSTQQQITLDAGYTADRV